MPIWHSVLPRGLTVTLMNFVPNTIPLEFDAHSPSPAAHAINPITFSAIVSLLEFGAVLTLALATGVLYHLVAYDSVGSI